MTWKRVMLLGVVSTFITSLSMFTGCGAADEALIPIDDDDISGVVTSEQGQEAGVWVIAETNDLPTKYIKTVVTDDSGQYLIPDLPEANYEVWVRGYGLVDSPKVQSMPGQRLNLTAVVAPSAAAAAHYYPPNYWYALLEAPPVSDFPGTGRNGNGFPEALLTQGAWIGNAKMTNACTQCHQMGNKATREISPELLSQFDSTREAWEHRTEVGIFGAFMSSTLGPLGRNRSLDIFTDWTDRIAAGELPEVPPRPQGLERNIVVTQWEYATEKTFVHDEISTYRQDPTINANGPIIGVAELSGDYLELLDPVNHSARRVAIPPNEPDAPSRWQEIVVPSPYWGEEVIWDGSISPHNPMFDSKGRVWITAGGGCRVFDPRTDEIIRVPGCRAGHHLQIDDNEVLWADANGGATYFDIAQWDETGDDEAAGGVISYVMDTNGNGVRDEPPVPWDEPTDPTRDKAYAPGGYSVIPNPVDGSVWLSKNIPGIPGEIIRVDPETRLSEVYEPPYMNEQSEVDGYLPHGIDVDRSTGVIWTGLNSGHYAEFDRRKCTGPLNGPDADGQHCLEGWTLHQAPGPQFKGVSMSGSADSFYLNWVDWHDTSGFGDNTPILAGTGSDSLIAFDDGEWVVMRVPYPMGFHARGLDGRIDDPEAGWKGRGLWSTHAQQTTWHQEGGKGERPKVLQFQLRPDPLAK